MKLTVTETIQELINNSQHNLDRLQVLLLDLELKIEQVEVWVDEILDRYSEGKTENTEVTGESEGRG